jgi:hypothetical protein
MKNLGELLKPRKGCLMKLFSIRAGFSLFAMTKPMIFLSLFLSGCADTENIGSETRIEINEQRKQLQQELKSALASKTTGRREVMIDVLSKSTAKELSKLRNGSVIGVYAWRHPMTGEVILDGYPYITTKVT